MAPIRQLTPTSQAISPAKFTHFVLRTGQFEKMIEWYQTVLAARIVFRDERLCFLSYDDERARNSRSPNTRPISLNEKNGICAIVKIIMTKRNALRLPSPMCGKLSAIVLPLNFPTTTSSTISNVSDKIVNATDFANMA